MTQFDDKNREEKVKLFRGKEEEELAKILSSKYGAGYVNLTQASVDTDALRLVPEAVARENKLAVFKKVNKKLGVAVLSPNSDGTKNILSDLEKRGYSVDVYMVSNGSLASAWGRYKDLSFSTESKAGVLDVSNEQIQKSLKENKTVDDVVASLKETLSLKKSARVSHIVESILAGALSLDASDVHLEPEETYVRLRFRLNGILTNMVEIDLDTYKLLLSRVKLLSGLKLNVREKAQDGRFSINLGESDVEIRASSIPGAYGESIVLRILNPDSLDITLEELGMDEDLLKVVRKQISRPNGMILNTGPTGSGKTTTLYAFLKKIHQPEIKIITIEDPVEYHLPGIVQTQVDSKKEYNFSSGLKSALRQDPDIIMVGEIRDQETAKIAVQSSLTGHLVLSTLHTNSAAGTFPRLIDLGVDPKSIGPAVNLAMAQRLIRHLDDKKKKQVPISDENRIIIERVLEGVVDKSKIPQTNHLWVPDTGDEDEDTAYTKRRGIFEVVVVDDEMEQLIAKSPREAEIKELAKKQGLLTMEQDGVIKALKGITSLEEVRRVIEL